MLDELKKNVEFELKNTAPCTYMASFRIPAADVAKIFGNALKDAQKHVAAPGFRKGKVPMPMVQKLYAGYISEEVEKQLQRTAFEKMSEDENIDIVSFGSLKAEKKPVSGEDYTFTLDVEQSPEIALPDYKAIGVTVDAGAPVDELAAKRLDSLKKTYADYAFLEDDGKAQRGDMLKVSYESDFVLPENPPASLERSVKAEENWIWMDEPEQYPGIIAGLTGASKGSEISLAIDFPADWREAGLAGKKVNYKFKVHAIERSIPETDMEKLAKKLHLESVEKMDELLRKEAEYQFEMEQKNKVKNKILEFLITKIAKFEIPAGVLGSATERQLMRIAQGIVHSEEDIEKFKAEREQHLEKAKDAAKLDLHRFFILRKIAKLENISVSQDEMDQQITMLSRQMRRPEQEIRKRMEETGGFADLQSDILMSKTLDKLAETAKVTVA